MPTDQHATNSGTTLRGLHGQDLVINTAPRVQLVWVMCTVGGSASQDTLLWPWNPMEIAPPPLWAPAVPATGAPPFRIIWGWPWKGGDPIAGSPWADCRAPLRMELGIGA